MPVYGGAELYAFPSLFEGASNTVVEAMACGVPVVAGRCDAIADIVEGCGTLDRPCHSRCACRGDARRADQPTPMAGNARPWPRAFAVFAMEQHRQAHARNHAVGRDRAKVALRDAVLVAEQEFIGSAVVRRLVNSPAAFADGHPVGHVVAMLKPGGSTARLDELPAPHPGQSHTLTSKTRPPCGRCLRRFARARFCTSG